jgi:uncharacterized protein (DUF2141 family)
LGSLAGYVYADGNNNGIKDPGEAGIGGATIVLTGTNDLGQAVSVTQTTAADGSYRFGNLRPGTYNLTEIQPADFLDGQDALGTNGGTRADDLFSNIVVTPGRSGENYNFGELAPASISGHVFVDSNNNGIRDPGEASINGVQVTLTGTDDLGQAVRITRTTVVSNSYRFTNLRPGIYTVTEAQPEDYLDGKDARGSNGGEVANDRLANIELKAGTAAQEYNFGELAPASLCGYVYVDANNNGIKEQGEAPLAGVTILLTGTDDLGQTVSRSLTTDADGAYSFKNLRPGSYAIRELQPTAYLDGQLTLGNLGGTCIQGQFFVDLSAGARGENYNFGELPPPPPVYVPPPPVSTTPFAYLSYVGFSKRQFLASSFRYR